MMAFLSSLPNEYMNPYVAAEELQPGPLYHITHQAWYSQSFLNSVLHYHRQSQLNKEEYH